MSDLRLVKNVLNYILDVHNEHGDNGCDCYKQKDRADELVTKWSTAIQRVRDLYWSTCKETVNGCSDDLEMFLYDLRVALDGEQEMSEIIKPNVTGEESIVNLENVRLKEAIQRVRELADKYQYYGQIHGSMHHACVADDINEALAGEQGLFHY